MAFPFLGLFIIFLSVAAYYRKRATAQQRKWRKISGAVKIRRTRSAARISAIFLYYHTLGKISNRYLWWWRINRLRKRSENPCLPENSKSEPSEQYWLKACLWSCESSCFVRIWPELYHPFAKPCRLCRLPDQKRIWSRSRSGSGIWHLHWFRHPRQLYAPRRTLQGTGKCVQNPGADQ